MNMPHSAEAERAVIGALMIDSRYVDEISEMLTVGSFFYVTHQQAFQAILNIHKRGDAVDTVLVYEELQSLDTGHDPPLSIIELNEITDAAVSTANIIHYAKTVKNKAVLRQIQRSGTELAARCLAQDANPITEVARFEDASQALLESLSAGERGAVTAADMFQDAWDHIDEQIVTDSNSIIPTHFYGIDDILGGGLARQTLMIIAGRPSQGKTALLTSMLARISARKPRRGVLFFSIEVSQKRIGLNLLCAGAKMNTQSFTPGRQLRDDEISRLVEANAAMQDALFIIEDDGSWKIKDLRARARHLKRHHQIDVVAVDYMQLIRSADNESREVEISTVSAELKAMAKELDVCVVALAQLNREVEHRENRRPRLSDLRGSGGIEQNADVAALIHWPGYYQRMDGEEVDNINMVDLIIAKHRDGPQGVVPLYFQPQYARFSCRTEYAPQGEHR